MASSPPALLLPTGPQEVLHFLGPQAVGKGQLACIRVHKKQEFLRWGVSGGPHPGMQERAKPCPGAPSITFSPLLGKKPAPSTLRESRTRPLGAFLCRASFLPGSLVEKQLAEGMVWGG